MKALSVICLCSLLFVPMVSAEGGLLSKVFGGKKPAELAKAAPTKTELPKGTLNQATPAQAPTVTSPAKKEPVAVLEKPKVEPKPAIPAPVIIDAITYEAAKDVVPLKGSSQLFSGISGVLKDPRRPEKPLLGRVDVKKNTMFYSSLLSFSTDPTLVRQPLTRGQEVRGAPITKGSSLLASSDYGSVYIHQGVANEKAPDASKTIWIRPRDRDSKKFYLTADQVNAVEVSSDGTYILAEEAGKGTVIRNIPDLYKEPEDVSKRDEARIDGAFKCQMSDNYGKAVCFADRQLEYFEFGLTASEEQRDKPQASKYVNPRHIVKRIKFPNPAPDTIKRARISPDGNTIAFATSEGRLYHLPTTFAGGPISSGVSINIPGHSVSLGAVSDDGRILLLATNNKSGLMSVYTFNSTTSGLWKLTWMSPDTQCKTSNCKVVFGQDGRWIVTRYVKPSDSQEYLASHQFKIRSDPK